MPRFLGDLERDARFVKIESPSLALSSTARTFQQAPYMTWAHGAAVRPDTGHFNVWEALSISALRYKAAGVLMLGPDDITKHTQHLSLIHI